MRKLLSALLSAILVLSCLFTVFPAADATTAYPCLKLDHSLVFIGDSNTVFMGKNNPDLQAARIFARVNARIGECVRSSSYHADGYQKSIKQLIDELEGSDFKTVIVNMGTNNLGYNISAYKTDYTTLLNRLYEKNPDATVYLCMILPVNERTYPGPYYSAINNTNVKKINAAVAQVQQSFAAKGFDARLLDLNTPFQDSTGNLSSSYDSGGGVHLSVAGYHYLGKLIQTRLLQDEISTQHSWSESAVTAPTCTATGKSVKTCTVCGTKQETVLPALGHAWSVMQILTPAQGDQHGTALYVCSRCGGTKQAELCSSEIFTDAPPRGSWGHPGVDWALFSAITDGTSATTFSPDLVCTRAQVVTFLWRAAGRPGTAQEVSCPFTDVCPDAYYYDAVLWAVENRITEGTSDRTFSPELVCNRAQVVTFLWRAEDAPAPEQTALPFDDVRTDDYFCTAVLWAVENGITDGTSPTKFSPNENCRRVQVVTFLWRKSLLFS